MVRLPGLENIRNDPDRAPILQLLLDAQMDLDQIDPDRLAQLPRWSQVTDLYGTEPVYISLETCNAFQNQPNFDPSEHFVTTAGTFNSGTNLMAELLIANCHLPARVAKYGKKNKGVRWEAVWGKHTPVFNETFRQTHRAAGFKEDRVVYNVMFPAVTVRDPYKWMPSMCRHEYGAHWPHDRTKHCPNLLPTSVDYEHVNQLQQNHHPRQHPDDYTLKLSDSGSIQVTVHYSDFVVVHDSLVHFWNEWYKQYLDVHWPRLLVRMEDVIFYPKQVTQTVCECAGGVFHNGQNDNIPPFKYITQSAKRGRGQHGDPSQRTTYLDAIIKYGTEEGRYTPYNAKDLRYIQENLDPRVMAAFRYKFAPADVLQGGGLTQQQQEEEDGEDKNNGVEDNEEGDDQQQGDQEGKDAEEDKDDQKDGQDQQDNAAQAGDDDDDKNDAEANPLMVIDQRKAGNAEEQAQEVNKGGGGGDDDQNDGENSGGDQNEKQE